MEYKNIALYTLRSLAFVVLLNSFACVNETQNHEPESLIPENKKLEAIEVFEQNSPSVSGEMIKSFD